MISREPHNAADRRARRRERMLKTVAVLPSLATLGNLVCGLGAIYLCMLSVQSQGADLARPTLDSQRMENFFPTWLSIAAYLLFGSMIFDALDGRLARFARKTSEFGAQLDSLCDIVSFGVAPVLVVLCILMPEDVKSLTRPELIYWRLQWIMAAVYVCCAAVRLARFNVENVEDESAHLGFRGLPTPGAACALVGMIILHQDLLHQIDPRWSAAWLAHLMPPYAMLLGLLMVSRFHYRHLVNAFLRGQRPLWQVLGLLIIVLVGVVVQYQATLAIAAGAYALWGPCKESFFRYILRRPLTEPEEADDVVLAEDAMTGETMEMSTPESAGDRSHWN